VKPAIVSLSFDLYTLQGTRVSLTSEKKS